MMATETGDVVSELVTVSEIGAAYALSSVVWNAPVSSDAVTLSDTASLIRCAENCSVAASAPTAASTIGTAIDACMRSGALLPASLRAPRLRSLLADALVQLPNVTKPSDMSADRATLAAKLLLSFGSSVSHFLSAYVTGIVMSNCAKGGGGGSVGLAVGGPVSPDTDGFSVG